MVRAVSLIALLIVCLVCCCAPAPGQGSDAADTLFRVGTFDRSSSEFSQQTPTAPVNFTVGKSNPAVDWYATQPIQAKAGENSADARAITFSVKTPAPAYQLHIALLIESPSMPIVQVGINGKHGKFYLHSVVDYVNGDREDAFNPIYSHADITFSFPGSYLHPGANEITLAPFAESGKTYPNTFLTYDAIQLASGSSDLAVADPPAQIVPTVFYQQHTNQLEELVDVYLRHGARVAPGNNAHLTIASAEYQKPFETEDDFGEEKLEFSVRPFASPTHAKLSWGAASHWQTTECDLEPGKRWTLYVVPHIHLDVGYTDYQAKVATVQSRVIDEAMDLIAAHPGFRFSLDGDWTLEQFMKTRTAPEQHRVITALRDQHLFNPAQYASLLTGFPTAETLIRSLYPSANFSRAHGTPFNYANITDVPTYTWSYASILHAAGLNYFLAGSDNDRGPVLLQSHLHESAPAYWVGPDGKKVLLWYARGYMQLQFIFGLPPELSAGREMLPVFLQNYEQPAYRANATILFGSQIENTDLFAQQAELAERWNQMYAYPRMEYTGVYEAMSRIALQSGNDIPTIRGDGGSYWEDGIASDAANAAIERENESRAPSAEKLSTIATLVDPRLAVDKPELDRMWNNMVLMDEHTWTSSNSVSDPTSQEATKQLAVKDLSATAASAQLDWILRSGMASVADEISIGKRNVVVFNTLNWPRSGLVSLDLLNDDEIVDKTTNQIVPVNTLDAGNAFHHVSFVAQNVPAVGYKVFALRHRTETEPPAAHENTTVMESPYYRIELDPSSGALRSIYDKQLQHELVDAKSPYRFGQYLYVTGGDAAPDAVPNSILQYSRVFAKPLLQIHPAQEGHLVSVKATTYGWVARLQSSALNTPTLATEIRLFKDEKKIELIEDVDKTAVTSKEAVYFAFPFAMSQPQFQYEIQTAAVDPARDAYPGAGREWFSVQHWVSLQQDGVSAAVMPLDASLVTLGDINRGAWPDVFGSRPGTVFSYVMTNYYDTNYRAAQGGHLQFRYIVTSDHSTDVSALSRMGWQEMTPLEVNEITKRDKAIDRPGRFSGTAGSFLDVQDARLLLETWKTAEDGNGTIIRFLDLGGPERSVTVRSPWLELQKVWQTDAVERNQAPLSLPDRRSFQFMIHPHEIVTVRLREAPQPK